MPRVLLVLGFCSLALAQSAAAQTPATQPSVDLRFAHPDADMKMSLNVQALLNSPSIAKAIEQAKSQAKDNAMQIQLALTMLKTVDRISVSVRQITVPQGVRDKAAGGMVSATPDVLVQVTGSFDSQTIAGFFPSTGSSKVKVVGPHTLLIGEGDSFARAVERMAAGAPIPGGELEQSDIWVSASSSFLAQQTAASSPSPQAAMAFQGLHDVSIGFSLGEAPEINVLLNANDAAAASAMLKTFQDGMGQVTQMNAMAGTAAKALSLKQDGSKLRLHFVVPPELIALGQQYAQQQRASGGFPAQLAPLLGTLGLGGPASSLKPPASATTPVPPPQNGGKIMIYGLDGGPQQVPAPH